MVAATDHSNNDIDEAYRTCLEVLEPKTNLTHPGIEPGMFRPCNYPPLRPLISLWVVSQSDTIVESEE